MRIVSIIPARSGSKGIPKKNIKPLAGYPLIAYSIIASRLSSKIGRTIVSTDSQEFANISRSYGAEVPFLRPEKISTDNSLEIELVKHATEWFQNHEGYQPEYIVILLPTTPLRDPYLVDSAIEKIIYNKNATSLRSAFETRESPYKLFEIKNGFFSGMFPDDPRQEYYDLPRQTFPPVYHPNGYVDVIKTQTINDFGTLHGPKILPFITPDVGELDRLEDFEFVEYILNKRKNPVHEYLRANY